LSSPWFATKPAEPGDGRLVLSEQAVAGERRKVFDLRFDVIGEMGARRMSRHLRLLPGRQLCVAFAQKLIRAPLEPLYLVVDLHRRILRCRLTQFDDLAFEIGNRALEIQISVHEAFMRLSAGTWSSTSALSIASLPLTDQARRLPLARG
jgi:hypothetical protein